MIVGNLKFINERRNKKLALKIGNFNTHKVINNARTLAGIVL
jgi:hypothetical protein